MIKRIVVDLDDYVDSICNSENHELIGSFKDAEGVERVINVLSDDMFKEYFENRFYSYNMTLKDTDDIETAIINKFNKLWGIFQIENVENLNKIVAGYYWDYVPVYNYDRTEEWKDVRSGNETDNTNLIYAEHTDEDGFSGSYKDTNTPSGSYRDTTHNGEATRTDKSATMDTDSFQNNTQSVVSQVENYNERTYNQFHEDSERTYNNYKETHKKAQHTDQNNTTKTYNNVTDIHEARLFGNIGVTTNVDMIEQEFSLRIHMLGYEFMKRFFDKFAFML